MTVPCVPEGTVETTLDDVPGPVRTFKSAVVLTTSPMEKLVEGCWGFVGGGLIVLVDPPLMG